MVTIRNPDPNEIENDYSKLNNVENDSNSNTNLELEKVITT